MSRIPVKQCTLTVGHQPKFYAEVGNTVTVRDGAGLVAATLERIQGDRVTVRRHHDDEIQELPAAEVVGVMHT
jgi:hypothetical protein